ncbi:hypothetical protein VPH35_106467 [Triticum aestivum]
MGISKSLILGILGCLSFRSSVRVSSVVTFQWGHSTRAGCIGFIESFNAENHKFYLGINLFTDLTNKEFKSTTANKGYKTSLERVPTGFMYENVSFDALPTIVDWRPKVQSLPSRIRANVGIVKLKTGKLISLSEQELVDCDVHGEDQGCEGGLMDDAFKFIIKNGGLTTESNYPYTATYDKCKNGTNGVATMKSYEDVPANNEGALIQAVASQPVSVAVEGGDMTFQFYKGRVMTGSCGTDLDHGIAAIGYGKTNDYTKYWLYLRTEKDIPDKRGMCGLRWSLLTPLHRRASSSTYVRMHTIN